MECSAGYTLNIHGRLLSLAEPQVMGILNCTPDSFYAGSRVQAEYEIARRANEIIEQGGAIIDVGAFSTRPGGAQVSVEEETARLRMALEIVRREQPEAFLSVDTFRPDIARMAVEEFGAGIINDVSEGGLTGVAFVPLTGGGVKGADKYPPMFRMVAKLGVPYILMSVKPTLGDMLKAFANEAQLLRDLGQKDIILDPGFGFGKTLDQNYEIMGGLEKLHVMELPVLVGVSRKSMIWKLSGTTAEESLNGTAVLNTIALMKGASILRVHDVKECVEAVKIVGKANGLASRQGN